MILLVCFSCYRVFIAVFLLSLSVYGVLGASVSVDVVDDMVAKENNTRMENSTKALNASKSILKIRAVDVQLKVVSSFLTKFFYGPWI